MATQCPDHKVGTSVGDLKPKKSEKHEHDLPNSEQYALVEAGKRQIGHGISSLA